MIPCFSLHIQAVLMLTMLVQKHTQKLYSKGHVYLTLLLAKMHTLYDTMFLPAYSGSPHAHNAAQGRASFFSYAEVCLITSEKGQNASAMIHWAENLLWRFKDSAGGALDAYFRSTQEIPLFDV